MTTSSQVLIFKPGLWCAWVLVRYRQEIRGSTSQRFKMSLLKSSPWQAPSSLWKEIVKQSIIIFKDIGKTVTTPQQSRNEVWCMYMFILLACTVYDTLILISTNGFRGMFANNRTLAAEIHSWCWSEKTSFTSASAPIVVFRELAADYNTL